MTEYGYAYQEVGPDASEAEAYAVCEGNVRASLLWDRWRAENAPTAEMIRARVWIREETASGNGVSLSVMGT